MVAFAGIWLFDSMTLLLEPTLSHAGSQISASVPCTRDRHKLSTSVSIEETLTNDSRCLVSVRLRSCCSMR